MDLDQESELVPMLTGPALFTIGSQVFCTDGDCGVLRRVVIDPVARALTHLVVEPKRGRKKGHLVPVGLVASTTGGVTLTSTKAEFEVLEEAEETHFLSGGNGQWGYGQDQTLTWPYYGLGMGGYGLGVGDYGQGIGAYGTGVGVGMGMPVGPEMVTVDRVPLGEVEVRRGDPVQATDGPIGRVQGLVVHRADNCVTHVLLDEGHLWGQKRVAIPIKAVTDVEDGVRLDLTKDEVRDLPPVEVLEPA
jgi:sporulation protein YlmC with PRC-barrel domain